MSRYVWRGFTFTKNSIVIQPSITGRYKGFGANLWGNLDTNYYITDSMRLNEIDLTLFYEKSIGLVNLGAGFMYYWIDDEDDAQEIYASMGLETILFPTLTVYNSFAIKEWYVRLAISHAFVIVDNVSLDLGGSVGYYRFEEPDYSELHDGLIWAGLTIPVGKRCTITPVLSYSFPLSSWAEEVLTNEDGDNSHLFGGFTVSIVF